MAVLSFGVGVIYLVNSLNEQGLEGLLVFKQSQKGNNRSVMPLDVLGRTCATLSHSVSHILNQKIWVIF